MKSYKTIPALLAAVLLGLSASAMAAPKSAAELEKEKAMANPYPNDFGPDHLDAAQLKDYPPQIKAGYKLLLVRCAQCHSPARPLNSRFVEPHVGWDLPPAQRGPKEDAEIASLKKSHPEYFKDNAVWQIEDGVWARYVKRMMAKPGCKITPAEGKQIYQFLVYDGQNRKLGANAEKWKAHRMKLVEELKAKKPGRYEELKKDNDL